MTAFVSLAVCNTHIHPLSFIQAIFDTDPKLDHAPMVQYAAASSIKDSHSLSVSDVQWVPDHIEVSPKTFQLLEGVAQGCTQIISSGIDG